ncbi:MAG TPA: sugar transferase, partial [Patescibacteria group bacterium]|nr:sugar transferase [Patescibacteria group bacterium]
MDSLSQVGIKENHAAPQAKKRVFIASEGEQSELYDIYFLKSILDEKRNHFIAKDYFDRIAAMFLIILFIPILLLAALMVKLTSPGPFLFKQLRRGKGGNTFECYKFRSMKMDSFAASKVNQEEFGMLVKIKDNPRITPVGRFLRKTSIDELPQLFNVLKGEMSFVGPRPLLPHHIDPHPQFRQLRSLVKPGITGIWQVEARSNQNTTALSMQSYDLRYIRSFSFWLDLKILFKTIPAVLTG